MTGPSERAGTGGARVAHPTDVRPDAPGARGDQPGGRRAGFDAAAHRRGGRQALHDGFTKYSPNEGYLDLREAIAEKLQGRQRLPGRPGLEVFVTVGAMEALALTFMVGSTCDEVLITDLSYTNFEGQITAGAGRSSCRPIRRAAISCTPRTWRPP